MSMLSNAVSGINAANTALTVTGQNVANASVPGYSRQTVYLETSSGSLNGVTVAKVDRVVNNFLNTDIWRTGSDLGYYQSLSEMLIRLETLLGSDSLDLNNSFANIESALNAALSDPASIAYRQQVISSCDALTQSVSQISGAIADQRLALNNELQALAQNASSITSQIADLNERISKAQALGQPTAELEDARELLMTELSEYMAFDAITQADGSVNITAKNGAPLVVGGKAASVAVDSHSVSVEFAGQTFPLSAEVGGRIGGLIEADENVLGKTQGQLEELLKNVADAVNGALAEGFDLNGDAGIPMFEYDENDILGTFRINPEMTPEKLAFRGGMEDDEGNWVPTGGIGDNGNIANIIDSLGEAAVGFDVILGDLAIQSKQIQNSATTAETLNNNAVMARDSVSGVNLDEEAANLMYYQQMYSANAKVISTAGELFNTLINSF